MRKLGIFLVATLFAASVAHAQSQVISDPSDWASGWAFSTYSLDTSTVTLTVEPTGGNPGARLAATKNLATGTAFGTAVYGATVLPAPVPGSTFSLALDVLSGPNAFGQGQAIQLLVAQGGSVYAQSVGITGFPLNPFTTITFNGALNAAAFTRVAGAGPSTPAFDGTTPTSYGFAAGNTGSPDLTQYYDNFRLTITAPTAAAPAAAIPTLAEWSMFALMLLLAGLATRSLARARRR